MLKKESLKSYIEELIQEVENELDEMNVTGNIDGYQTPHAFSRKSDNERRKKNATQLGYELVDNDVNNIDEAKTYKKGDKLKIKLPNGKKFDVVFDAYGKQKGIAFGKFKDGSGEYDVKPFNLDTIVESVNEYIEPQTKKIASLTGTRPDAVKQFVSSNALNITKLLKFLEKGKLSDRMDFVTALSGKPGNPIQKKVIKMFSESVNEAELKLGVKYTNKQGKEGFIQTGGSTNPKDWFWFDGKTKHPYDKVKKELKPAKDQKKTGFGDYLKQGGRVWDNVNKNGNSVNENRWLELKNDDSMHANKKLAVGLKELKYQLAEVEKFFSWYNKIKNINELDSDNYWKRTNTHIYKIKERLINIARTLQEIEK